MILCDLLTSWIFEAPACFDNQVSVLQFDEYIQLLPRSGVTHRKGAQCPFGALSSKLTSWVYFMVDMDDMPDKCPYQMRKWYCDSDRHRSTLARHPPTTGMDTYSLVPLKKPRRNNVAPVEKYKPKRFVSGQLAAYPNLLNRYLDVKIQMAIYKAWPIL